MPRVSLKRRLEISLENAKETAFYFSHAVIDSELSESDEDAIHDNEEIRILLDECHKGIVD